MGERAIVYDRVSEADPESQAEHLRRCRQFADARGWDVVAEFHDTASGFDRSAKTVTSASGLRVPVTRPGWLRVVEAVERGDVDHVVVFAVSRAGRNLAAFAAFVELCKDRGVTLASATEPIDSAGPFGIVFQALLSAMAELESATKRERALVGEANHRRLGTFRGGHVPFGYRVSEKAGVRYLVLDRRAAAAIRRGASDILNGKSLEQVARDWNARELYSNGGKGKPWTGAQVRNFFDRSASLAPAILTESDLRRVRTLFDSRRLGRAPERYLLGGLVVCAVDGSRLRGRQGKYACISGTGKTKLHLAVSTPRLDEFVFEEVSRRAAERPFVPVEARDPSDELVAERERILGELRDLGLSTLPLATIAGRAERLQQELATIDEQLEQMKPTDASAFLAANPDLVRPDAATFVRQHVARVVVLPPATRPGTNKFDGARVIIEWHDET